MIKPMQATSDGDAYESNDVEGIWTAGINLPFGPKSIYNRPMDPIWSSRIECHGESKEDAEELRDAVLAVVTTQQVPTDGEWERFGNLLALEGSPRLIDAWNKLHSQSATQQAPQPVVDSFTPEGLFAPGTDGNLMHEVGGQMVQDTYLNGVLLSRIPFASQPQQGAVAFKCERARIVGWWNCQCDECRERAASNTIGQQAVDDAARLDAIAHEYWKLDPFDMPTGAGDADVGWRVVNYHGDAPRERVVAEVYEDDPRKAIDAALAAHGKGG